MMSSRVSRLWVLPLALMLGAAHAEELVPPTVGAAVDRSEAHVGDRLTLTISAVARAGIAVSLPAKLELGPFEILDRAEGDKEGRDLGDGQRAHRFVLGVAAYALGDLELPPIEVRWLTPGGEVRTVRTNAVTVHVRPLLNAEDPQAQPLRAPRSAWVEDVRVMRALRIAGVALGLLFAAWLLWRWLRRLFRRRRLATHAVEVPTGPKRPPEEVAIARLVALRERGHFDADGYRPFYFALSEIVRDYLGARYGFDALEMTTTELLDELKGRAPHLTTAEAEVPRLFGDSDLVKFAKAGSTDQAALAALDTAQAIVLSTAAPLEEVVRASSGPNRTPEGARGG